MYVAHFGLRSRPFRSTPDPAAYYPATGHESALHQVQQALSNEDGLALVSADPGCGKTLLATVLIDRIGDHASCLFLTNGHLDRPADLYQAALFDLGVPYVGRSEQELRLAFTENVLQRFADGHRTILLLDEAHHSSTVVWEELRQLGNLETRQGKAVQAILFALPEVDDVLRRSELRALRQRLTVRAVIDPMPPDEAADFILHHLRVAGARPEAIISDEAVELIARAAAGVPRVINQAAHLALAVTCEAGEGRVDVEGALEALARLGLEAGDDEPIEESRPGYLVQEAGRSPRIMFQPGLS